MNSSITANIGPQMHAQITTPGVGLAGRREPVFAARSLLSYLHVSRSPPLLEVCRAVEPADQVEHDMTVLPGFLLVR